MIVSTALLCLAANIYHEARGEPVMGQYAVALVTLNRAKQEPEQVCQEVFKRSQFSWTIGNVKKVGTGWQLTARMLPKDAHAWWMATRIAQTALAGRMPDFTQGSRFYHSLQVAPAWRHAMVATRVVGNHLFYKPPA